MLACHSNMPWLHTGLRLSDGCHRQLLQHGYAAAAGQQRYQGAGHKQGQEELLQHP